MLLNILDYHCRKMSLNVATFAIILSLYIYSIKNLGFGLFADLLSFLRAKALHFCKNL